MSNMMKRLNKHSKRRGAQPTKVLFSIEILSICDLLPALSTIGDDAMLSVCFERGGKMSCSTEIPFNSSPRSDGTLTVKQTLSLVATLYQEASGEFQEKTAKLILRQSKTSRIVGTVFKGLGVVLLKLNELMQELLTETNKALSFPMEILKGGDARINVVISARTVAGSDGDEDSASLLSDTSDISTLGAVFDADDFPIGALMTIGSSTATPDNNSKKLASSSSSYQSYNEMKDKRNPIAETILEVDDEEDSPEVEEALTDWLDEAETPVIDSSDPINIKPISQVISKIDSNNIDAHSVRNDNASKDSHLIDDVIVEEKINKTPSVTQHAQEPKTFTASDSSTHTAVSSASANKYDSTQRTLSHQTVINETKRSPVAPVVPVAPVAAVPSSSDCLGSLPLSTQKSPDSDLKKDNAEMSRSKVGTKSINTVTTSPLNKIMKDNDNIDTKKEDIEKANVKSNAKQKNVTEIKKKNDDAKKTEKEKEVENENRPENEEIVEENNETKENLEIKTTIISPILKSSSSMRSTESEEFGKNFSPLFPEPNYVSPSLTAPLGAEGEETLEAGAERLGIILPPRMSNEVLDMKASITMLTRQLSARDIRIAELEAEALLNKESYRLEVCTLRCDLIIAQTDLKRETADRMDLEAGFVTEDNFLTSRYSKAQKGVRELTTEYASCCAMLRNVEQELFITKKDLRKAQISEAVETAAAVEAAGVATSSALRRAELEEETDGMLEALINSKIQSADLAIQVDEERKKIFVLRRRLQKYAEKMAAMELATVVQGLQKHSIVPEE